ncbi:MAG: non-canonical purine NTP pyrophosphatase, RdgB/HAM1 family [Clostridiales bacterium]|nr:MAG: non-canonical purine NTP pyrophosphatase, RdgB/HAM1 family [Clostridiales bacterium]HJA30041.1 RdgB/HAM1 family non-canonical purine NTP pyrophosphatase [Candidatus Eisenbergiella pullicola]
MKDILFATGNAGKMKEIREILEDLGVSVYSLKDAGIDAEIEENGTTFAQNARLKAEGIAAWCKRNGLPALPEKRIEDFIVLADDSGLEVDRLNREPGVYSARYMGHDTSYREKNANIIERLDGVPKEERTARFVCAIAAVFPDGSCEVAEGTIEGYIGWEERGENGFGYDPIFYLYENDLSTAELSPEKKNGISHRGKALQKMKEMLRKGE